MIGLFFRIIAIQTQISIPISGKCSEYYRLYASMLKLLPSSVQCPVRGAALSSDYNWVVVRCGD